MATESSQYDLKELTKTDIQMAIEEKALSYALTNDPFVSIPGVINLRDLGALPLSPIRRGLVYRSGALHNLPTSSRTTLRDTLGIRMILDLRSQQEIKRSPEPIIEGVRVLHFESSKLPTPLNLEKFVENGGIDGYVEMYEEVLEIYGPSIKAALEWIRDEGTPMLFHCTAGKDRTGGLAAILHLLAGTPAETVAFDFALTRVGVEPARELLLQMLKMWNKEWTSETPGLAEFSAVKEEFMLATLGMVEKKYGGVEGYLKGLGFEHGDLEKTRRILRSE